jgi:hypothetical protein
VSYFFLGKKKPRRLSADARHLRYPLREEKADTAAFILENRSFVFDISQAVA